MNFISGWHKDSHGYHSLDPWKPSNGESYGVYRIALYLQEYDEGAHKGCSLSVKRASHLIPSRDQGEIVNLYAKPGDAIIFDARLTHSGHKDILRRDPLGLAVLAFVMPWIRNPDTAYRIRDWFRKVRGIAPRYAIFYGMAKDNVFAEEHIKGNVNRQNRQTGLAAHDLPEDVRGHLRAVGIRH